MLLQETIEILHLSARSLGNTPLAATLNQLRVAAFLGGHGVDHNLHSCKHFRIDVLLRHLGHLAHTRQFIEHAGYPAHIIHLLQLFTEVFKVEFLTLFDLARQLVGFLFINFTLYFLNQGEYVAHPKDARSQTVRMKGVQRSGLLPHTEELDRLTGNRSD